MKNYVNKRVATYFHVNDYNCVRTDLLILAEYFKVTLGQQILDAAVGMHGAGGYRAQCGLVEGTLLFLGLIGAEKAVAEEDIVEACHDFGRAFEAEFSSLQCKTLRPGGFMEDDPPHLCEDLACRSIIFSISFVEKRIQMWREAS
ncbi:Putative redox-active protein [Desulfocapsa sulfexigens DSM 10523]|uniref:Putative redox-active protein n=1 Tax=Desulfocapsa sulfexigens (strain DSM 10523 / SB164P1) TaxID=1167006 RepID=M1P2N5_DESSD|nr:C-GCAxxG-C-C family protein [Desulfocapsa sulfexigens]AGF77748.1 Putative redox-active protein [Desulfocapsa sulfexigens DSM 10523]